jgi:hypothetical protein
MQAVALTTWRVNGDPFLHSHYVVFGHIHRYGTQSSGYMNNVLYNMQMIVLQAIQNTLSETTK